VRILAACSPGEVRAAAVDDAGLLDYAVWRPGAPDGVGDLHRGRIAALAPAMAGAFVRLEGAADGFLPDSEGGAGATEGQALGVRVVRAAQGGKGPRLTAHLEARLAALRVRNDNAALSAIETAALRGEIRALKTLLRLREDRLIFSQD